MQKSKITSFGKITGTLNSPKVEDEKDSSFNGLRIQTADLDDKSRSKTDKILKKIERNKFSNKNNNNNICYFFI